MPPRDDDWSDSDDDVVSEVETTVLLGVPDGQIESPSDKNDVAVSRIGGHPVGVISLKPCCIPILTKHPIKAFLSNDPLFSSSFCKVCSQPMKLLVQMWCPFEESPMDRSLYIWGCSRTGCQKKDGSIRAWRGLRYNHEYAAKLAKKRARKEIQKPSTEQKPPPKSNPFSMTTTTTSRAPGLGTQIFGDAPSNASLTAEGDDSDAESEASTSSEKSLITAMAVSTLTESDWNNAPAFNPLYLSTVSEYLPPLPKAKLPAGVEVVDASDDKNGKDVSWASEAYEDSMEVDKVFERFNKIVGHEGEQCVRYDLGGRPLLFASDKIFDLLFPKPPSPAAQTVTKAVFTVAPPVKRHLDLSAIPPCPHCKSKRVFECQLMPNLINILSNSETDRLDKLTDEQRRKVIERTLKGTDVDGEGMEWGTCLVFSCEKDCCVADDGFEATASWREEQVLVQWDI